MLIAVASHARSGAVLAAISRDSDAYRTGRAIGVLLLLALGIALLVAGLRSRRQSSFVPPPMPMSNPVFGGEPPTPPAPPGPGDFFAPAAPPQPATWTSQPLPPRPSQGGLGLIVAGSVVLVIALLGGIASIADLSYPKRTVLLPETLVGEPRNVTASQQLTGQFADDIPKELKTSVIGAYGSGANPDLFLLAGTGHLSSPSSEISSFKAGLTRGGQVTVTGERTVPAGPLGGKAKCFDARIGAVGLEFCVFVDRGSFLATIDRTTDPVTAASRGLQARNAVVHKG